jgi:hypothetical protein
VPAGVTSLIFFSTYISGASSDDVPSVLTRHFLWPVWLARVMSARLVGDTGCVMSTPATSTPSCVEDYTSPREHAGSDVKEWSRHAAPWASQGRGC